jgi:hypothetical protein
MTATAWMTATASMTATAWMTATASMTAMTAATGLHSVLQTVRCEKSRTAGLLLIPGAPQVAGISAVLAAVTGCSWIVTLRVAPVAATQQPGRKLQCAALTDAVVCDGTAVVQLLARVGQVLVANHFTVLVLHLAFDSANGV